MIEIYGEGSSRDKIVQKYDDIVKIYEKISIVNYENHISMIK